MEKMDPDEATFEELIPALVSYCLFTRSEIMGFMYNLLDEDKDNFISKTDLFAYLLQMRSGQRVFPSNVTRCIEIVHMLRGDYMDIKIFAQLTQKVPFIMYPAVRLQTTLRIKFGGERMWRKLSKIA